MKMSICYEPVMESLIKLARANYGEKLFGSRRKSHVKPTISKICNVELDNLALQDVES